MRVEERNMALSAERQWKNLYEDIKKDKQEAMRRLQELQLRVNSMEHQVEETIATVSYTHLTLPTKRIV